MSLRHVKTLREEEEEECIEKTREMYGNSLLGGASRRIALRSEELVPLPPKVGIGMSGGEGGDGFLAIKNARGDCKLMNLNISLSIPPQRAQPPLNGPTTPFAFLACEGMFGRFNTGSSRLSRKQEQEQEQEQEGVGGGERETRKRTALFCVKGSSTSYHRGNGGERQIRASMER